MKVALGSDHRAVKQTRLVADHLAQCGIEHDIVGPCTGDSCDYPDNAYLVAKAVADGRFDRGIVLCSNGIGVTMAANKVRGIRAALVCDIDNARRSREHNDANVLCLGSETVPPNQLVKIVDAWLETEFEAGGRHERRVMKIAAIERGEDPTKLRAQTSASR